MPKYKNQTCCACGDTFSPNGTKQKWCKSCCRHEADECRLRLYGVNGPVYDAMLAKYDGCCWICRQPGKTGKGGLAVDHDHATGQVRGLLCFHCNHGVHFLDKSDWMKSATEYLA